MSRLHNLVGAAVVAVGVAVQVDAVDAALSTFFAYALPVVGWLLVVGWLVREAWDAVQDWHWMGPPDLGPLLRAKREREDIQP